MLTAPKVRSNCTFYAIVIIYNGNTMFKVFGGVISQVRKTPRKAISIDNAVAQLHYRITFWLLLASTCLVCSRQYIGEAIRCVHDKSITNKFMNTYCFFTPTYTVYNEYNISSAYPGIGPHTNGMKITQYAYYQWVPFVLFGQALLFYLPHYFWKVQEGDTIRKMVNGLQRVYLRSSDAQVNKNMKKNLVNLGRRIQDMSRFRLNRYWASMLVFCELLNLLNVVVQLVAMDYFLGGNFLSLGERIWTDKNAFDIIFPKMTKCNFYKYGASGGLQNFDAMCVMALNVVNEKIYVVLWFWFVILIPITSLALLWRVVCFVLYYKSERFNYYLLKETTGTKLDPENVVIITRQACFSDWLLLYYLGSNMDSFLFVELLDNLAAGLENQRQMPEFEFEMNQFPLTPI